jgi:hypothetical protein
VIPEHKEHKEPKEQQGLKGLKVIPELKAQPGPRVHKESRVFKVSQEERVFFICSIPPPLLLPPLARFDITTQHLRLLRMSM